MRRDHMMHLAPPGAPPPDTDEYERCDSGGSSVSSRAMTATRAEAMPRTMMTRSQRALTEPPGNMRLLRPFAATGNSPG